MPPEPPDSRQVLFPDSEQPTAAEVDSRGQDVQSSVLGPTGRGSTTITVARWQGSGQNPDMLLALPQASSSLLHEQAAISSGQVDSRISVLPQPSRHSRREGGATAAGWEQV